MFNFFQNLQDREKKLLFLSLLFLTFLLLFFFIKNSYVNYSRTSLNLIKAKSDYEYVFNKVDNFQRTINKRNLNQDSINSIIVKNNLENSITDIKYDEIDSSILINFSSLNINDAVSFTEKIINNHTDQVSSIKYQNFNSKVKTELKFN
jgi:ABC-type sugar transport system permease subunit